jgi:hypothetical protein
MGDVEVEAAAGAAAGGDGDAGVAEAGDVALDGADVDPEGVGEVAGGGGAAVVAAELLDQAVLAVDPESGQVGLGRGDRPGGHDVGGPCSRRPATACRAPIVGSWHGHDTAS